MNKIETNTPRGIEVNNQVKIQVEITRAWVVASSFVSIPIIVFGLVELLKGK